MNTTHLFEKIFLVLHHFRSDFKQRVEEGAEGGSVFVVVDDSTPSTYIMRFQEVVDSFEYIKLRFLCGSTLAVLFSRFLRSS
jgi:hypothetical protein